MKSNGSRRSDSRMSELEITNPSPRSWTVGMDSSSVTHLFEFDLRRGIISNELRNARVFLLGADVWQDVESELAKVFSAGAFIILNKIGRAYGSSVAKKLKGQITSITALKQLAASAGWGRFFVRLDEENGSWIRVDAEDCVFCHGDEQSSEEGCYLLAGLVQGIAEEFYDREYTVIRKKCYVSDGLDFTHTCEIVLQQASENPPNEISKKLDWVALGEEFR
jgi:predicted hydrocarbon binding protein